MTPVRSSRSALFVATALTIATAARAADRWIELDTPNFRVLSNASETKAREIAMALEAFRVAVDRTWRGINLPPQEVTTVFAFRDDATFTPYKGLSPGEGMRLQGETFTIDEGYVIALNVTRPQDVEHTKRFKSFQYPYATVFHEFTHRLLSGRYSKLPAWVGEGMSEYLSTFWLESGKASVGRPILRDRSWMEKGFPIPIDDLMAATRIDGFQGRSSDVAYTEAWALVFYLTQPGGRRTEQFGSFLSLLLAGTPQAAAFARAFGATPQEIADETRAFFAKGKSTGMAFDFEPSELSTSPSTTPLSKTAIELELAELAVLTVLSQPATTEQVFREILATSPENARALAGLGLLLERTDRRPEAEAAYRRALAADPESFTVHFRLGRLLLDGAPLSSRSLAQAPTSPASPRTLEARTHLQTALLLRPAHTATQRYFGSTFLVEPGDRSSGLAALEAAGRAHPDRWDLAWQLAILRRWEGDRSGAIDALGGMASLHATPAEVVWLRTTLTESDRLELQRIADTEGRDQARAWLERASAETHDAAISEHLRRWQALVAPSTPKAE